MPLRPKKVTISKEFEVPIGKITGYNKPLGYIPVSYKECSDGKGKHKEISILLMQNENFHYMVFNVTDGNVTEDYRKQLKMIDPKVIRLMKKELPHYITKIFP